ncbi:zinc-dependent alcohol dehydrogenase family protein [Longibacter sp.]|uniref:zinc-dependent alcohol dehydrogenase family protein n=1 Tax=Longibacter sp. TaxID=2045415 RepID=UPI003EB88871
MRSLVLEGDFGIDQLSFSETDAPTLDADRILVRMKAAAVNYVDLLLVNGELNPHIKPPFVPLSDGAGIVEAVGDNVNHFAAGDRIVTTYIPKWVAGRYTAENGDFTTRPGSNFKPGQLVEQKTLNPRDVIKLPKSVRLREAATLPIAGVTAWNALRYPNVKPGETVLLHGTGGVAIFALQFAKAHGARVIITSSSDEKLATARDLGADHGINYATSPDWTADVLEYTDGTGVDVVVETVGGDNLNNSLEVLRPNGHISIVGFLSGRQSSIDLVTLNLKRATLHGLSVGNRQDFEEMLHAIDHQAIRPVIDRVFPFSEAAEAFRYVESAQHVGKVVIEL